MHGKYARCTVPRNAVCADDDADYVLPAPVTAFDKDVAGDAISELVATLDS